MADALKAARDKEWMLMQMHPNVMQAHQSTSRQTTFFGRADILVTALLTLTCAPACDAGSRASVITSNAAIERQCAPSPVNF
jgi:hypothetical protein